MSTPSASPAPAPDLTLVGELRSALAAAADAEKAPAMQAYMHSALPFRGVPAPALRRIVRDIFRRQPFPDAAVWQAAVLSLWREAAYREERYAAIELTGLPRYRPFQTLDTVPMYREMIVTGAWWDYVDAIAIHRIGGLLRLYPAEMRPLLLAWRSDEDRWLRRSAILAQVSFKADTDLGLLYDCIEPNLSDRDFFIRKAIGWALRAYAWVDPDEVARYVAARESLLSPLSRREALKNAGRRRGDRKPHGP